ncbi:MAG: hypothetical protein AAGJ35_03665 [Myxococcota bacterium]
MQPKVKTIPPASTRSKYSDVKPVPSTAQPYPVERNTAQQSPTRSMVYATLQNAFVEMTGQDDMGKALHYTFDKMVGFTGAATVLSGSLVASSFLLSPPLLVPAITMTAVAGSALLVSIAGFYITLVHRFR